MKILFAVCMRYADDSMNVNWRNVFELQKSLKEKGHECEYVSIISQSESSKTKK